MYSDFFINGVAFHLRLHYFQNIKQTGAFVLVLLLSQVCLWPGESRATAYDCITIHGGLGREACWLICLCVPDGDTITKTKRPYRRKPGIPLGSWRRQHWREHLLFAKKDYSELTGKRKLQQFYCFFLVGGRKMGLLSNWYLIRNCNQMTTCNVNWLRT